MKPALSHPLGYSGEEKNLFWIEADFLKYLWKEIWKLRKRTLASNSKAEVWFSQGVWAASFMMGRTGVQSSWDSNLPTKDYWLSLGSQGSASGSLEDISPCFRSIRPNGLQGSNVGALHWIWQVPTLPLAGVWNCCVLTDVLIYRELLVSSNNKIDIGFPLIILWYPKPQKWKPRI